MNVSLILNQLLNKRVKIYKRYEPDPNKYYGRGILSNFNLGPVFSDEDPYFEITDFRTMTSSTAVPLKRIDNPAEYVFVEDRNNNAPDAAPAAPAAAFATTPGTAAHAFAHPLPVPTSPNALPMGSPYGGTLPGGLASGATTPVYQAASSTNNNTALQPTALAGMFNAVANNGAHGGPLAPTMGASTIYPGLPAGFNSLTPEQYASLLASMPAAPPTLSPHNSNNGSARRSRKRRATHRKRRATHARRRHRRS